MIELIIGGIALLALIAVIVGVVDSAQASAWRRIAAARREQWEARQPEFHGYPESYRDHTVGDPAGWDED